MNIFRRPTIMATLIAVIIMAAVNYYHLGSSPLLGLIIFALVFFALFSAFMAWVERTNRPS